MATAKLGDRDVEIIEPDDWTTRELFNAEKALGVTFDGSSAGAAMAITMYISLRRVEDPIKPDGVIASEVLDMKFKALTPDEPEEADPLGAENGHSDQQSGGLLPLAPLE